MTIYRIIASKPKGRVLEERKREGGVRGGGFWRGCVGIPSVILTWIVAPCAGGGVFWTSLWELEKAHDWLPSVAPLYSEGRGGGCVPNVEVDFEPEGEWSLGA